VGLYRLSDVVLTTRRDSEEIRVGETATELEYSPNPQMFGMPRDAEQYGYGDGAETQADSCLAQVAHLSNRVLASWQEWL
jgi:hypothetical protein